MRAAAIGILTLATAGCGPSTADQRSLPAPALAEALFDPTDVVVRGQVGAGGAQPLLARTNGRVANMYFFGGEYVRQGQPLVKLFNRRYVVAPRNGFLGANYLNVGQYLRVVTPVTTISLRSYLVVPMLLSQSLRAQVQTGDSVLVQAADHSGRGASGIVSVPPPNSFTNSNLEVRLPSRAPFRIGEAVNVRFKTLNRAAALHLEPPE